MAAKKKRVLSEAEWSRVFHLRCQGKQGRAITPEERALVDAAFEADPKRYAELESEVFNATVPFGSNVRYGDRGRKRK